MTPTTPPPALEPRFAGKAPFPWFGGKSKAAPLVWQLLGDPPHYVEPFAGALGVLLNRPHPCNRTYYSETINDLDGFVVNAWRAMQWHPVETAQAASWPVSEADKQARQIACLKWRTDVMLDRLAGDATFCDPLIAGWWLYGVCCQIGAFAGGGPWTADESGRIYKQARNGPRVDGVKRDRPHLSGNGQGVNRPQLREPGVSRDLPHLSDDGRGVNTAAMKEPGVLSDDPGNEFHGLTMPNLIRWFQLLSARLRHVRIVNGGWTRVCTSGAALTLPVRQGQGPVGVFLDPPYDTGERARTLYAHESDGSAIPDAVRAWALKHGDDPRWRIVIAGYDTEHEHLEAAGWAVHEWFTAGFLTGGMGNTDKAGGHQQHRERLWSSPHCLDPDPPTEPDPTLF